MASIKFDGLSGVIKSLGVVFGDIGTSPLYTFGSILANFLIGISLGNILGIVSLLIWALIILVMIEYAWLAMSLGRKGEGGTIVLKEILTSLLKSRKQIYFVTILSFVGVALFFSDGMITPAITIITAVEGIKLIPGCGGIGVHILVIIAIVITILLFAFQRKGTEKVSVVFGPVMLVWFILLGVFGLLGFLQAPEIIKAINPYYGIKFLLTHGFHGFFVLGGVVLCVTGGEALYADMGHLGRKPIRRAWYFVFVVLIVNYLGQGAFVLAHPQIAGGENAFFAMVYSFIPLSVYVAFLILCLMATVIASQSLISAMFSVFYQGIVTHMVPMLKITYTSSRLRSQIYIGAVNWVLMVAVLGIILIFQKSENLANAYGFAVTGTMTITAFMMVWIFMRRNHTFEMVTAVMVTLVVTLFFLASLSKLPERGLWALIIDVCPLSLLLIYNTGRQRLLRALQPMRLEVFLEKYLNIFKTAPKLKGSALFFVRDIKMIEPYVTQTIFKNNIIYEDNILIEVIARDDPFGVIGFFKGSLAPGLRLFEIHMGYMEVLDIEKILSNAGINATVMFYGMDEIVTRNVIWKIYAFIKHITPSFVQFYKLPTDKLHGVVTSIEM